MRVPVCYTQYGLYQYLPVGPALSSCWLLLGVGQLPVMGIHNPGYMCAWTSTHAPGRPHARRLGPKEWAAQRAHMASVMRFGSVPIGRQYGVYVTSPYTQKGVRTAALALGKEECVRVGGLRWGGCKGALHTSRIRWWLPHADCTTA